MSDEEELTNAIEGGDDFDTGGGSEGRKGSGGIVKILSWIAGIILGVIFVVTVVYFTMKIIDRGNQSQSFAAVSQEYKSKPPTYKWFQTLPQIRGRTADKNSQAFIIKIELGYADGKDALDQELTNRAPEITDLLRSFFSGKNASELEVDDEENLKLQIKEKINRIMNNGPIETVVFTEFQILSY